MSIPSDFAADLQRNQTNLPTDILARLILFYQKSLDVPENDIVVDTFYYSPLIDLHNTAILLAGPTITEENFVNHIGSKGYTKFIPETVHSDPLVYNFTNASGITFDQPDSGNGARFNGAAIGDNNSYIVIDDHPSLNITDEITFAFWFFPFLGSGTSRIIHKDGDAYFVNFNGTDRLRARFSIGGSNINLDFVLTLAKWHHVVATCKSGNQELYVDNVLVASDTEVGSIDTFAANLGIMARADGTQAFETLEGLSWFSMIHGYVDSAWVANDFIGIRDVSDVDEIICFPFMQALNPQPPMTSGIFVSHT